MKKLRKIIEIDEELCDGCGQCVPSCAEGAIRVINGKARLVSEVYCDGLGACLGECPTGALRLVEREAEDFDEEAAERYVRSDPDHGNSQKIVSFPCPGTTLQTFNLPGSCDKANIPSVQHSGTSALTHWPIQIRLIPPTATFLKGADLLVAADCVPVACPDFHSSLLRNRVVLLGCPKFDDAEDYVTRFTNIFRVADIKSVTIAVMDVPCCQGLPAIIDRAVQNAGISIPIQKVTIGREGEILKE